MKYFFVLIGLLVTSIIQPGVGLPVNEAQAALPKLIGESGSGFGGFITGAEECTCGDLGILITVSGPFGGNFLISFIDPPEIKLGAFTMVGGPVLGATEGGITCGEHTHDGCENKRSGTKVKYLAGIK